MKTKLLALSAVIFSLTAMAAHAGGGFIVSAGPVTFAAGNRGYCGIPAYCPPVARACYPVNYGYYPQPIYYSWGPTTVYYSSGPVAQVSSPFTTGVAVPAPVIYQVPAPVLITQPVVIPAKTFGWKQ